MTDAHRVVFDVHVWVLALTESETFPRIQPVPPTSDSPSVDCLSIAFDADEFSVWSSPHILRNTVRVLRAVGVSQKTIEGYLELIHDTITVSGGRVIDPPRVSHDSRDHEDNLILDLAVAADAVILVTDDTDLTPLSPWMGRLILRPHEFVAHVVALRRTR